MQTGLNAWCVLERAVHYRSLEHADIGLKGSQYWFFSRKIIIMHGLSDSGYAEALPPLRKKFG